MRLKVRIHFNYWRSYIEFNYHFILPSSDIIQLTPSSCPLICIFQDIKLLLICLQCNFHAIHLGVNYILQLTRIFTLKRRRRRSSCTSPPLMALSSFSSSSSPFSTHLQIQFKSSCPRPAVQAPRQPFNSMTKNKLSF